MTVTPSLEMNEIVVVLLLLVLELLIGYNIFVGSRDEYQTNTS